MEYSDRSGPLSRGLLVLRYSGTSSSGSSLPGGAETLPCSPTSSTVSGRPYERTQMRLLTSGTSMFGMAPRLPQSTVCPSSTTTARNLSLNSLVEEFLPADRARARTRTRRASSRGCHSRVDELRWLILNANFITRLFWAEELGIGASTAIVDDGFTLSVGRRSRRVPFAQLTMIPRRSADGFIILVQNLCAEIIIHVSEHRPEKGSARVPRTRSMLCFLRRVSRR